ncbi:hypothetical protein OG410_29310 [Streptomyces sp. NBC_00659]|uniref:hypothetical protein n=1 Tax=Streptomyces sp. NBC_00659 TaxID=2903669 RepID=UPI002E34CFF0|nr:hypothetical protein [Streptomyces sp. NBC_00659]
MTKPVMALMMPMAAVTAARPADQREHDVLDEDVAFAGASTLPPPRRPRRPAPRTRPRIRSEKGIRWGRPRTRAA